MARTIRVGDRLVVHVHRARDAKIQVMSGGNPAQWERLEDAKQRAEELKDSVQPGKARAFKVDGKMFWLAKTKSGDVSLHMMEATAQRHATYG